MLRTRVAEVDLLPVVTERRQLVPDEPARRRLGKELVGCRKEKALHPVHLVVEARWCLRLPCCREVRGTGNPRVNVPLSLRDPVDGLVCGGRPGRGGIMPGRRSPTRGSWTGGAPPRARPPACPRWSVARGRS